MWINEGKLLIQLLQESRELQAVGLKYVEEDWGGFSHQAYAGRLLLECSKKAGIRARRVSASSGALPWYIR